MNLGYIKFWLKAANSKGHGTHSPFVYDFIINVLNDDRIFYSFTELTKQRRKATKSNLNNLQKIDELLFRMVDYYTLHNMAAINVNPITEAYLVKANAELKITKINNIQEPSNNKFDAIYIDVNNRVVEDLSLLITLCLSKSFVIVNKNHNNLAQQKLWNSLVNDSRIDTTIDLYHLGIAVINNDFKVKQPFNIRY